jgi:cell division initiation protein
VTDLRTEPSTPAVPRATPQEIRDAAFPRTIHGYDQKEVRAYLEELASQVESADVRCSAVTAEAAELRQEVARLRAAQPGADVVRQEISVQAVELLSKAQQAADEAVSQAEQYARDLVLTAREQYREIIQRAQETAGSTVQAVEQAVGQAAPAGPVYDHPLPEIEYVRTFARVAQSQLKSVLDALAEEVDKLGQLPQLATPARANPGSRAPEPRADLRVADAAPVATGSHRS